MDSPLVPMSHMRQVSVLLCCVMALMAIGLTTVGDVCAEDGTTRLAPEKASRTAVRLRYPQSENVSIRAVKTPSGIISKRAIVPKTASSAQSVIRPKQKAAQAIIRTKKSTVKTSSASRLTLTSRSSGLKAVSSSVDGPAASSKTALANAKARSKSAAPGESVSPRIVPKKKVASTATSDKRSIPAAGHQVIKRLPQPKSAQASQQQLRIRPLPPVVESDSSPSVVRSGRKPVRIKLESTPRIAKKSPAKKATTSRIAQKAPAAKVVGSRISQKSPVNKPTAAQVARKGSPTKSGTARKPTKAAAVVAKIRPLPPVDDSETSSKIVRTKRKPVRLKLESSPRIAAKVSPSRPITSRVVQKAPAAEPVAGGKASEAVRVVAKVRPLPSVESERTLPAKASSPVVAKNQGRKQVGRTIEKSTASTAVAKRAAEPKVAVRLKLESSPSVAVDRLAIAKPRTPALKGEATKKSLAVQRDPIAKHQRIVAKTPAPRPVQSGTVSPKAAPVSKYPLVAAKPKARQRINAAPVGRSGEPTAPSVVNNNTTGSVKQSPKLATSKAMAQPKRVVFSPPPKPQVVASVKPTRPQPAPRMQLVAEAAKKLTSRSARNSMPTAREPVSKKPESRVIAKVGRPPVPTQKAQPSVSKPNQPRVAVLPRLAARTPQQKPHVVVSTKAPPKQKIVRLPETNRAGDTDIATVSPVSNGSLDPLKEKAAPAPQIPATRVAQPTVASSASPLVLRPGSLPEGRDLTGRGRVVATSTHTAPPVSAYRPPVNNQQPQGNVGRRDRYASVNANAGNSAPGGAASVNSVVASNGDRRAPMIPQAEMLPSPATTTVSDSELMPYPYPAVDPYMLESPAPMPAHYGQNPAQFIETAATRVDTAQPEFCPAEWVIRDGHGRVIRRFIDIDGDHVADMVCTVRGAHEMCRDINDFSGLPAMQSRYAHPSFSHVPQARKLR